MRLARRIITDVMKGSTVYMILHHGPALWRLAMTGTMMNTEMDTAAEAGERTPATHLVNSAQVSPMPDRPSARQRPNRAIQKAGS